ncbi:unnamed protein product [Danaus chrysippus]|uniref:Ribosome biogenesis protein BOP1 homolog n=1 Tax=Danaus chrysippus TaxID=151541 RepID=A0A8J2WA77_9NEOP|nr:unnamed protein product [Danaus chrysippus]
MPPFKAGLLKRKNVSQESKNSDAEDKNTTSGDEDEELVKGFLDEGDDAADSEHEEDGHSDGERDASHCCLLALEVLFEEHDSTLGDDEHENETSEPESSDLTDSEEGEETDEDEGDSSQDEEHVSSDSGAETGLRPTTSSGEETAGEKDDKKQNKQVTKKKNKQVIKKKNKQVTKMKQEKKRNNKTNSIEVMSATIQEDRLTAPVQQKDEYESGDTSDEEDRTNTVGDIPMWWYNEYPHIGYTLDGQRIIKPPQRDQIDEFLKKCSDPEFWRTVKDPQTGQDVVLAPSDLRLLERLRASRLPSDTHDEYEPWVEWFSREVLATPLRAFPDHKRSFLPSRSEQLAVSKLVHALKMGWTKTRKEMAAEKRKKKERAFYDLWSSSATPATGGARVLPAPKRALPGHAESYNPPAEYLLDDKEMKEWDALAETPWKRKYTFLPQKHSCLRDVEAFPRFVRERFLRCLDLYLAPRALKMRLTINAEDLVPKLPSPRDLQPFPTAEVLQFRGHTDVVRSCDFDPSGQYVVSGSEDGTLRVWESSTGRCVRTVSLGAPVTRVSWSPSSSLCLVSAAAGPRALLLNVQAGAGAHRAARATDRLLAEAPPQHDTRSESPASIHASPPSRVSHPPRSLPPVDERTSSCVEWEEVDATQWALGVRISIKHFKPLTHLSWHARGDYLAATLSEGASRSVVVHQLSRRRSQLPFRRACGLVQAAVFHPRRPLLLVATQRAVRIYDLVKQELSRKLRPGAQWLSSLAVHPGGDHLLLGSYDRKLVWFDLELSARPYRTLRVHGGAVRAVAFHPRYPLFASGGDDPYLVVCHGTVYNDLLTNPLLVPLKQLPAGEAAGALRVLDLRWHPHQPWLLAAGADSTLRLYS